MSYVRHIVALIMVTIKVKNKKISDLDALHDFFENEKEIINGLEKWIKGIMVLMDRTSEIPNVEQVIIEMFE